MSPAKSDMVPTVVLDSGRLSLGDAADRLAAARNVREDEAKLRICAAVAQLRLRISAHVDDDDAPKIAEINDTEISDKLTPTRLNWALSRPAIPAPMANSISRWLAGAARNSH
jgi:hypothetical protein